MKRLLILMLFLGCLNSASASEGRFGDLRDSLPKEQKPALDFLTTNMPKQDSEKLTPEFIAENIEYAYRAKENFAWTKSVPEDIFRNYILPYANLNEKRDPWRKQFFDQFSVVVADCKTAGEATIRLNLTIFDKLNVHYSKKRPKPDQSPLESIEAGTASCTGLSILLVDACRSVGIPARVVGTAKWTGSRGNHTWVEIWDDGWHYIGASESKSLDSAWFSKKAEGQKAGDSDSAIFAASFKKTGKQFPLVWAPSITYVHATDITARYAGRKTTSLSTAKLEDLISRSSDLPTLLTDLMKNDRSIEISDIPVAKKLLWQKYVDDITNDPPRQTEQKESSISYNGKTMRYVAKTVGKKPDTGYPLYIAMHGGGGAPARVNDSQWKHMQVYYLKGVTNGIYLAPRGMNNAWNLHWITESFACYDRIIENLIAFGQVDPNRVYLMGFSAGGDSSYQIPARAADRWAGVAMSAGHPNGVKPDNYANLAFLIQVGERDAAYKRNTVAAEYGIKLNKLGIEHPGLYKHDAFIHVGRGHGFMDRDPSGKPQKVFADCSDWLENGSGAATANRNCNSIHWLREHVRNPLPSKVIWDCKTTTDRSGAKEKNFWPTTEKAHLHYWLGLDRYDKDIPLTAERIVCELDKGSNSIQVSEIGNYVKLYLSPDMLDLNKNVAVKVEGRTVTARPELSLRVMVQSLLDRGDPSYIFPTCLTLSKNSEDTWLLE